MVTMVSAPAATAPSASRAMDRLLALLELGGLAAAGIGEAGILRQLAAARGWAPRSSSLRDARPPWRRCRDARGSPRGACGWSATKRAFSASRLAARNSLTWPRSKDGASTSFSSSSKFLVQVGHQVSTLAGARLAEALEGAMAHALVGRQVGFLELVDAAAMGGAADHVEVELERVEDVHDVQHDVRRAQHVAARIEQHVGGAPLGRRQDLLQRLRRQLHAGEQPHRLRHVAEAVGGVGRADRRAAASPRAPSSWRWSPTGGR